MTSHPRFAAALASLFAELEETCAWQRDLVDETARATLKRDRLVTSIRATIDATPRQDRTLYIERLRALTGADAPPKRRTRPTARTRLALAWLATREPAEFHVSELRAHFEAQGHTTRRNYLPTLLSRWRAAGLLDQIEHGRYRVNRDHPELEGMVRE